MKAARSLLFAPALVFLSLAGGCAARTTAVEESPQQISGSGEDREMWQAVTELELRKAELARLQGIEACDDVCRLSNLICTAGARICGIAQRHGGHADYANRCLSAKNDCRSARAQCGDCK